MASPWTPEERVSEQLLKQFRHSRSLVAGFHEVEHYSGLSRFAECWGVLKFPWSACSAPSWQCSWQELTSQTAGFHLLPAHWLKSSHAGIWQDPGWQCCFQSWWDRPSLTSSGWSCSKGSSSASSLSLPLLTQVPSRCTPAVLQIRASYHPLHHRRPWCRAHCSQSLQWVYFQSWLSWDFKLPSASSELSSFWVSAVRFPALPLRSPTTWLP